MKQSNKVGANENIDLFVLKPNFTFKIADGGESVANSLNIVIKEYIIV